MTESSPQNCSTTSSYLSEQINVLVSLTLRFIAAYQVMGPGSPDHVNTCALTGCGFMMLSPCHYGKYLSCPRAFLAEVISWAQCCSCSARDITPKRNVKRIESEVRILWWALEAAQEIVYDSTLISYFRNSREDHLLQNDGRSIILRVVYSSSGSLSPSIFALT